VSPTFLVLGTWFWLAAAVTLVGDDGKVPTATPHAVIETEAVPSRGDAADDPAIWIHPDNPAQSLVLGTDKKGHKQGR
jgi:myo-inositol-hexaphosphate 3-phosphohydrolase